MSWTSRALIAGAALITAVGGGRLVQSEVRLASHEARRPQTDRRDALLAAETARTASLELALAEADVRAGRAADAVTGLRAEMGRAEAELLAAEAELQTVEARSRADAERLAALRAREQTLTDELQRAAAEAARAGEQRQTLQGEVERLSGALHEQRQAVARAEAQVRTSEGELAAARGRAGELEAALREARGDAERALGRAEARARELDQARTELSRYQEQLRQEQALLERLRAEGVKVDRLGGARPIPAVRAMILRTDPQALPMEVLIDAGARAGLETGDRLWVLRGSQEVARLELSEVRPDSSTARVVRGDRQSPPHPGDVVVSWKPGQQPPP